MAIEDKDVRKVAHLARLKLSDDEVGTYRTQLARILGHMDELSALKTDDVVPTAHVLGLNNVLRKDEARPSGLEEKILGAGPEREGPYMKVPKVIE
jgi:aspartyl-tRNA(Asn)/glutamyl-tRNA(Gln) amidotransferase subunit C